VDAAASKAREVLSSASSTQAELREAQEEIGRVKDEIAEREYLLDSDGKKPLRHRKGHKKGRGKLSALMLKLREYEILLGDILRGPVWALPLSAEEISFVSSTSCHGDSTILPSPLLEVHEELRRLPKDFVRQSIAKKRRIIHALCAARSLAADMDGQIKQLEKKKYNSCTPKQYESEMKSLSVRLLLISSEMKKFQFE
jgi:hypothetical protein